MNLFRASNSDAYFFLLHSLHSKHQPFWFPWKPFWLSLEFLNTSMKLNKSFIHSNSQKLVDIMAASAPHASVSELEKRELQFQKTISRTYLVILCVFIGIYVPAVVMIYILHLCQSCDCTFRHVLRDVSFLLFCTHSCVNPFIYAIRVDKFRTSLSATFRRQGRGRSMMSTLTTRRSMTNNWSGNQLVYRIEGVYI